MSHIVDSQHDNRPAASRRFYRLRYRDRRLVKTGNCRLKYREYTLRPNLARTAIAVLRQLVREGPRWDQS